ncbi:AraC family transcriptional regulator [Colwellia sp. E2M01]|uniref:AraC family transcriptional regulator n=1 Tax=Colwellia sp. E2M01 TaxID=2841561 RepID=UPI001C09EA70|nr:AraC family transcriptional regulator [Colwellia sp. E2M01]MBU2870785.1 AraC family transcriptional regulator [Colwellia sp. E2M01]
MKKINGVKNFTALISALLLAISFSSIAEESAMSSSENKSNTELALELEQLKSQVLKLNRELFILEEDLLFPASTQLAVFVSVDTGKFFAIDSVEVKINDKEVAGFLYTERQRKALEQGGIQKLYLGNLKMGEYQLTAIFTGLDPEGRTVKRAASYDFEKDDEALMIELKVVDNTNSYRSQVVVEEWVL